MGTNKQHTNPFWFMTKEAQAIANLLAPILERLEAKEIPAIWIGEAAQYHKTPARNVIYRAQAKGGVMLRIRSIGMHGVQLLDRRNLFFPMTDTGKIELIERAVMIANNWRWDVEGTTAKSVDLSRCFSVPTSHSELKGCLDDAEGNIIPF
jgi:hypothetical protein